MPDTQTPDQRQQEEQRLQHEQQTQYGQPGQPQYGQPDRPQAAFDESFVDQVLSGAPGTDMAAKYAREYFNVVQSNLRIAQELAEWTIFTQMKAQLVQAITAQVRQQVTQQVTWQVKQQILAELQTNPSILKPVIQREMASR